MSYEDNVEAQPVEVADPQYDNAQVSEDQSEVSQEQLQKQRPSSEDQERNWRALRDKVEEAERRNKEYERKLSDYETVLREVVSKKDKPQEIEEEIDESDIPTFGQTRKAIRREAEKIAKEIVKQTMEEREQSNAPKKLKNEHSDFDEVVTKENVDYLIKKEPELAAILRDTKDIYKQGKMAYKFIKSLGIAKNGDVESMKQDASRNMAKPISPNAISNRNSVGDANAFARRMTPELQKQLYKEMCEASRSN